MCDDEENVRFTYEYGANGQSSFMKDTHLGRIRQTEYDLAERPVQSSTRDTAGNLIYRTTLTYDGKNRLNTFAESLPEESHKTSYTYDKDNRTTAIQFNDSTHKVAYGYDALGRVISRAVTNGSNTYTSGYTFENGNTTMYGSGATTPLVKKITQNGIEFEYAYDERGNIVSEKRGSMTTTYAYDALGQLTRVNDPHENKTWVYEYDFGGNIKCKKRYAYTTAATPATLESTINYTYGDSNWKDKLTAYNGVAITYDAIGNPLTDGTWTYTWEAGRQLKKMVGADKTIEFKYNAAGLRTQKKVTEGSTVTTTDYTLHGKLITHMTVGTSNLHFFYDNASHPAMVKYNGVLYTYVHNLQGDIVGIVDASGNLVVEYKYDAWGRPLSTTGTMKDTLGKLNPFRYRGYTYDKETGLYYLKSRYYKAEVSRFLTIDNAPDDREGINSYNLYSYCKNMPIKNLDENGYSLKSAILEIWNTVSYEITTFTSCIEFKVGIGGGIGYKSEIKGVYDVGGYAAIDIARASFDENTLEIDQALIVDVGAEIFDSYGLNYSYVKPRDLENPSIDVPADRGFSLGVSKAQVGKDLVIGISGHKGLGVMLNYDIGFNVSEYVKKKMEPRPKFSVTALNTNTTTYRKLTLQEKKYHGLMVERVS